MSHIGPFQPGDTARIPLEITINGVATAVANPRVQQIVLPDGTNASGYPQTMSTVKTGTYVYETTFTTIGNYTAILQAEFGNSTIEQIAEFVVERPFGYPRIEIASDS